MSTNIKREWYEKRFLKKTQSSSKPIEKATKFTEIEEHEKMSTVKSSKQGSPATKCAFKYKGKYYTYYSL